MNNKRFGFTLAEVLITLSIIGVIAALTVPALINNANEKALSTERKKAYSTISVLSQKLTSESDLPLSKDTYDDGTYEAILTDLMAKYLKTVKTCHNESGCWHDNNTWYKLNKTEIDDTFPYGIVTVDGMYAAIGMDFGNGCPNDPVVEPQVCIEIVMDVNGAKKPNMMAKDIISFELHGGKVLASGSKFSKTINAGFCDNADTEPDYLSNVGCTEKALEDVPLP